MPYKRATLLVCCTEMTYAVAMTTTLPPAMRGLTKLVHELEKILEEVDAELPPHAERRRIRVEAGLSQAALSRCMGVADRNVCNWEDPAKPEPAQAHRLVYQIALLQLAARNAAKKAALGATALGQE